MADQRLLIALVLAACGGKAAPPAVTPPVGNEAEPPATELTGVEPDEQACKVAMRGELVDEPVHDLQLVHPRPGEKFGVCLIATLDTEDQRIHFELSPIRHDGETWVITESGGFALGKGQEDEYTNDATATIELFPLSPDEQGIRYEVISTSEGPEHGQRQVMVSLFRIQPDGTTVPVLEFDTTSSTGEADDVWEKTLTRLDRKTGGFYDVEIAVAHRSAEWAAGASGYDEEDWTETWTWNGSAYEMTDSTQGD